MHRFSQQGLTLIELLITISIMSIIATLSIGSFHWIVERSSAASTRSNIERTFSLARFIAVTEQTIVTICPLDTSNKCVNDWSLPTAVFRDPGSALKLTDTSKLLRSIYLSPRGTLTPSNSFFGPRKYFQYQSDGSVRGTLGNFTWCPESGNRKAATHVRINFGGRLIWSRDYSGNQIVETSSGADVSC
ncbi:MAG TPA: GspH/FimT family pseudopilin [Marinobacter sp.]|uniref:GspH/FimT family pseudopilin n=1 Tax=Marinobacter sp. TaxID=50741 RepID=UPI002D7E3797|nr:GspH/FimT family pseudopilin [Marinobacter sp.]HET8801863.1 GspH/FimT family pseudopilin [Marinobacter sp.]